MSGETSQPGRSGSEETGPLSARLDRLALGAGATPRETARPGPAVGDPELAAACEDGLRASRAQAWRNRIPSRFVWATVEDFTNPASPDFYQPAIAADLAMWGSPDCATNLVLLGPTGSCKTHAAIAAGRLKFERGQDVRFYPVVELLHDLRPGGPEGLLDELSWVDVLILDDVGAEKASEWTAEQLYAVVNRLWMECLPTVATSNVAPEDLRAALTGRLFSRLVGDGAMVRSMTGKDRRLSP